MEVERPNDVQKWTDLMESTIGINNMMDRTICLF